MRPIDPRRCGTTANWQRHHRLGEKPCRACREAHNARNRREGAIPGRRRGIGALDWAKCGTEANYRRHYRLGEKPCDKCRIAYNRIKRDRRRK